MRAREIKEMLEQGMSWQQVFEVEEDEGPGEGEPRDRPEAVQTGQRSLSDHRTGVAGSGRTTRYRTGPIVGLPHSKTQSGIMPLRPS